MKPPFAIALTAAWLAGCGVAAAQVFPALPGLPEPIPAPLAPPRQAPVVNGPMIQSPFVNGTALPGSTSLPTIQSTDINPPVGNVPALAGSNLPTVPGSSTNLPTTPSTDINPPAMQPASPGVLVPPTLNTFSDRTTQCLQTGSSFGLSGPNLSTYSSVCAN
jgi:hypothetical protein